MLQRDIIKKKSTDPINVRPYQWAQPKNVIQLRELFGLAGYRKFNAGYDQIARPFMNLLKKQEFVWNKEASRKYPSRQHLVLRLRDFSIPFIIETDKG